MKRFLTTAALTIVFALSSGRVEAGQIRIDVASNLFVPNIGSLNLGDQVAWVWVPGSSHSVTQGPGCDDSNAIFDSGLGANQEFSWKSDRTGSIPYFCIAHCGFGMTGNLNVSGPVAHVPVSDFRITEVRQTASHDNDYVEIANLGDAFGNLGRYRVSVAAGSALELDLTNVDVAINGRVVLHFGASGPDTETDFYFPAVTLPAAGSAALYLPNSVAPSLADTSMLVDFVQWGGPGQANETTAAAVGYWTGGQFVADVPEGHAIEFCGTNQDRGHSFWAGITSPNPGSDGNCQTPVTRTTWSGLKTVYR